ncbi:MAG: glycosyltransferase family 39 protein [Flavobacteriales bacterium]
MPPARPLLWLTIIALVPRLVAAIFSQGYFAHDDHFLVIEAAHSWVKGYDYNDWLPWNQGDNPTPSGHGFVYVGAHYLLFSTLDAMGMEDPKVLMLVVRLLHALLSLVVVRTGYRMAVRMAGEAIGWRCGLFLALFFFMPFLAVRNLFEVACMPFLMLGAWQLVKRAEGPTMADVLIAGTWIGLAVNIRFQTLFFAVGPGLVLLFGHWRKALVYGLGVLIPVVLLQGGIDLVIWGKPFAEISQYVSYNLANPVTYFNAPWWFYLPWLAGVFIPPLSVLIFLGYFSAWRKHLILWLPVFLFITFHSWHPNKQDRFILTILPLFFIIGYCAWEERRLASNWWKSHQPLWNGIVRWTWTVNTILLIGLTFTYSKRSRCEAMYLLRQVPDITGIIMEDSRVGEAPQAPLFYLGDYTPGVLYFNSDTMDQRAALLRTDPARRPNMVCFIGTDDLAQRRMAMERQLGTLTLIGEAEPGLVDGIVHWLNPVNRNETIAVYRLNVEPRP